MSYGTLFGYGEGGYGTELPTSFTLVKGCNPLLKELNYIAGVSTVGIGYGVAGAGTSPYGGDTLLMSSLNALGTGRYWAMGIDDSGTLTYTLIPLVPGRHNPPVLKAGSNLWQLDVDLTESIILTQLPATPTSLVVFDYIPLQSPSGFSFKLTATPDGNLQTTQTFNSIGGPNLLPDEIPYPPDVTMSIYGNTPVLICTSCGNASVTASADLSLWCCTCSSFVPPEDTNVVVVLDE